MKYNLEESILCKRKKYICRDTQLIYKIIYIYIDSVLDLPNTYKLIVSSFLLKREFRFRKLKLRET